MAIEVKIPQMTQTMTEGTVTRWLKQEGETVRAGEPLFEVVTDKAALEVESPSGGVLTRILLREGEAPVGTVVAVIAASGETLTPAASPASSLSAAEQTRPTAATVQPTGLREAAGGKLRVSPVARRVAAELGVDLAAVTPSGPGGLITEADVRRHKAHSAVPDGRSESAPGAPAPPVAAPLPVGEDEEVVPLTAVRKIIADRLSLSRRTAADVTTVAEVDMSEVSALREHVDITYTAFVARAVALALAEFPALNSRLERDRIVLSKRIHLGVAVAIDEGLKVPVIRDAQTKSLRQMGLELAEKARLGAEGKLPPEDLTGSTFTVTNSGVFGSLLFTPIINPPESAILGMGKIAKTPVVRDDQIVIRKMMYLCLTYDHRVIDGAPAVKFLQRVKALLEKPDLLL